MMSERQEIWEKVAAAFGTPGEERNSKQRRMTRSGMCYAFDCVNKNDSVDIYSELDVFQAGFWLPSRSAEGDHIRSTFACFMSVLSDREYKEMVTE